MTDALTNAEVASAPELCTLKGLKWFYNYLYFATVKKKKKQRKEIPPQKNQDEMLKYENNPPRNLAVHKSFGKTKRKKETTREDVIK